MIEKERSIEKPDTYEYKDKRSREGECNPLRLTDCKRKGIH